MARNEAEKKDGNKWQLLMWLAAIIFTAGVVYSLINENTTHIHSNQQSIEKINEKVNEVCSEVVGLQKDVYYIRKQTDKIYEEVKKQ